MNRRLAALAVAAAVTWTFSPAFAQEPPPGGPDPQAPAPEAGFRGLAGAGDPALRAGHHERRRDRHRRLHGAPHQGPPVLRNPEGQAREGIPVGEPDRQDDARRRLRRPGRWATASSNGSAAAIASCCAACRTRWWRRAPARSRGRSQAANHDAILMAFNVEADRPQRGAGDRRDASLHDRRAGVQRPHAGGRAHVRPDPLVRGPRGVVPRERRGGSDADLQHAARSAAGAAGAPAGGRGGAPVAARQRQRRHALQHGAAAREADDAPPLRRARRLLLGPADGLRPGRASRAGAPLHHPLPPREEGPVGRDLRAGEADRLLDRSGHAGEVGAVSQARRGELAERVRSGRVQERDPRQGGADAGAGSRLESGRRALLGDPLAAVDDRERLGPAHPRSADRRDSRSGHPVLPQRHEPGARLVLRAGRPARPAREDAAAARRRSWAGWWNTSSRTRSATPSASSTT